jgi:radical SAM superfamily enzyme YgiQ (UPF0313 family)
MRWCMVESADKKDSGSAGAAWVRHAAELAGQPIEVVYQDSNRYSYDVELVSVHHQRDYERLVSMPKRGHLRIVGGHITYTNPRPLIPLADVVCLGDGESWIAAAVSRISEHGANVDTFRDMPGTICSDSWQKGNFLPALNIENTMPNNPPYLSKDGSFPHWNIEIAKGCPYRCGFCEIGNTVKFRYRPLAEIEKCLDAVEHSKSSWVRLICPEEGSHPQYEQILEAIKANGLVMKSGGYRVEQILRRKGMPVDDNQSIRIGVDGLTEATRRRVNKPITDRQILDVFNLLISQGHVKFKIYQIFGYSWDTADDFQKWERFMNIILAIPLKKSCILEITWTPFMPQPGTPLENESGAYNEILAKLITAWHNKIAKPKSSPGWYVNSTRMISKRNHESILRLTNGDETELLDGARYINPVWRKHEQA